MRLAGRLVFIRHGESIWNVKPRFTGWADVPLSANGVLQSSECGKCLHRSGLQYDAVFTSVLQRSTHTFELIAKELSNQRPVTTTHTWRLNERHYGALVGLSKSDKDLANRVGKDTLMKWRKGWSDRPPPMEAVPPGLIYSHKATVIRRHPIPLPHSPSATQSVLSLSEPHITEESSSTGDGDGDGDVILPLAESLSDCADRALPLFRREILPRLLKNETILIVAHSNTIRSMLKYIEKLDPHTVGGMVIPPAIPLVYTFEVADDNYSTQIASDAAVGGGSQGWEAIAAKLKIVPTVLASTKPSHDEAEHRLLGAASEDADADDMNKSDINRRIRGKYILTDELLQLTARKKVPPTGTSLMIK